MSGAAEKKRTEAPGAAGAASPGHLNNSSEELFTLDILRGRELRLEARPLRRSSAAWAALAQEVSWGEENRALSRLEREEKTTNITSRAGNTYSGATTPLMIFITGNSYFWRTAHTVLLIAKIRYSRCRAGEKALMYFQSVRIQSLGDFSPVEERHH
jgi:hypothetical protein